MDLRSSSDKERPPSISSLRILAPPMRLISAAMWRVMQQKDVLNYGKLEDFVTAVSEAVPGLLSNRHRAKLTLGLRARLILELCQRQDPLDSAVILPHLERIQLLSDGERDRKVTRSAASFQLLVRALLDSSAERDHFFQEVFAVEYGPQFDAALQKLFWEFLSRLDQLLPVPDLAQTVLWLSAAPGGLEDIEQPEVLNTVLQHHRHLGHLSMPGMALALAPVQIHGSSSTDLASLPSTTGDSILSSLSLPPSGRVRQSISQETHSLGQLDAGPDSVSPTSLGQPANHKQRSGSPIQPVFGLITNQDLSLVRSEGRRAGKAQATPLISMEAESVAGSPKPGCAAVSLDRGGAWQEGAEEIEGKGGAKRQKPEDQDGGGEGRAGLRRSRRLQEDRQMKTENRRGPLPMQGGAGLSPEVISSLQIQPQVMLERLSLANMTSLSRPSARLPDSTEWSPQRPVQGATPASSPRRALWPMTQKRKLRSSATPERCPTLSAEKENRSSLALLWGGSPVLSICNQSRGRGSPHPDCDDDIVIDSEDEEIKSVKGRLFVGRYYRTKNNTIVPTLREFWGQS
ncbi:hypothetical protein GJAV_G00156120 [Gymnothorax javanicus]|nr:hypothetical protein GJAV_G00156120 [Gymnothorax javanicus]